MIHHRRYAYCPTPLPLHPATAPAPALTALNPSFACSKYPIAAGELSRSRDLYSLAISLAVAVAAVAVVEATGGGEVSRVGLSGGEGAKISLGDGGEIRI
jgi:hypothetical protein